MPERRPLSLDELHALAGLPAGPEQLAAAKHALPTLEEVLAEMGIDENTVPSAEVHKGQLSWNTVAEAYKNFTDVYHQVLKLYEQRPHPGVHLTIKDTLELGKSYAEEHQSGKLSPAQYIERLKSLHYELDLYRQDLAKRNVIEGSE